jgi:long-chain acyl-CoA synthetase
MHMSVKNLLQAFSHSVGQRSENPCFRYVESGSWQSINWNEAFDQAGKIAGGLQKLGVEQGDRVCLLSKSRYEWTLSDLGILGCGAVSVPIYESSIADQIKFIVNNSEAKVIIVENDAQLAKLNEIFDELKTVKQVVYFSCSNESVKRDGFYSLDELMMLGSDVGADVLEKFTQETTGEDVASIVYTSGTTGNPKGVVLTHGNFLAEVRDGVSVLGFEPHHESLIFLPLAHILARAIQFAQIYFGFVQCYAESIEKLTENISQVRPHFLLSVPRIFEKIHMKTLLSVESAPSKKKKIFYWALEVGQEYSRLKINGQSIPTWLSLKYKLAHKIVYSKLHQKLGGRIEFFVSGGAPLAKDVANFFFAFGFTILEGYGLTETTAAVTVNRHDAIKLGTVGKNLTGVTIKIADDGEILVKGKQVFKEYYKNPDATQEAIDPEGWFHTGDIGVIDEEGFLAITDRKKDIIITAGGKNIAPQNIENFMKADPYISQFVVHGDKRKFLSALITLDRDEIENYAKKSSITFGDYETLVKHEEINSFIRKRIDEKNSKLARYETIKRFAILPSDFSVESGELTPTLKVKRRVIEQRYEKILNDFYEQ